MWKQLFNNKQTAESEEELFADFDLFVKKAAETLNYSILTTVWKALTRTNLMTMEQLFNFVRKYSPLTQHVDHFLSNPVKSSTTLIESLLQCELQSISTSTEDYFLRINAKFAVNGHGGSGQKNVQPQHQIIDTELLGRKETISHLIISELHIVMSAQSLLVRFSTTSTFSSVGSITLEWSSSSEAAASNEFFTVQLEREWTKVNLTVSDENVSKQNGLLHGIFDFYGRSSELIEYWKRKGVKYSISSGRKCTFVNNKLYFKTLKLTFANAVYNLSNVNPELLLSLTYKPNGVEHYLNSPLQPINLQFENISFYSACLLMSHFKKPSQGQPIVPKYHNSITSIKGKTTIDIEKEWSKWTGIEKCNRKNVDFHFVYSNDYFSYEYDWKVEKANYESTAVMPRREYLRLKGFGFISPFEFHCHQKPKEIEKLFEPFQLNEKVRELLSSIESNRTYFPQTVTPLSVTGHFEGILQIFNQEKETVSECSCNFFLDTILGFVQIDLTHFNLGVCKLYYKANNESEQPPIPAIHKFITSSRGGSDVSIVCLN